MSKGEEIVARARRLVGTRFRPQGRDPAWGLDCVGLAALALEIVEVRGDYALRGGSVDLLHRELARVGLDRAAAPAPGDVIVMQAGARQLHLGIATGSGIVHADAGLRRVVERPGPPPFELISTWRLRAREEG